MTNFEKQALRIQRMGNLVKELRTVTGRLPVT